MFCPRCGQKQLSDGVRFCSSCGFQLEVVSQLLPTNGQLGWHPPAPGPGQLTPRQKGIRQGAMLFASTFLIVPVSAIFFVALLGLPAELVGLAAVICFVGGILRMLYARFIEDNTLPGAHVQPPAYVPPAVPPNYLGTPAHGAGLPPAQQPPPAARPRPQRFDTGELVSPPSVVDHTTRLLNKQPNESPDE